MRVTVFAFLLFGVVAPLGAQTTVIPPPPLAKTVSLSGPRFGVTSLSDGVVAKLHPLL